MAQTRTPAAHWSKTPLARLIGPMQAFINHSQASSILLFAATLVALALANSPLQAAYQALLDTPLALTLGPFILKETLLHWVNDGLMVLFFFLVGLEIKRELLVGELATPRAAALPIIAACGGALVPALIFLALNGSGPTARSWGIPMATDIAFALGCLALLGSRVPFALKVFLTAVAIVDDLLAVLVIALFYSNTLNLGALALAGGVLLMLLLANRAGLRSPLIYAGLGVVVWLAFLRSGVHATLAGVLVALTVPARSRIDAPTFVRRARELLYAFESPTPQVTVQPYREDHKDRSDGTNFFVSFVRFVVTMGNPHREHFHPRQAAMLTDEAQQTAILALEDACEQVRAPLQKMEHGLQRGVSLLVMPLFALANAGVSLTGLRLEGGALPLLLGIVLGLVLGKPLGLLAACWLAVRSGIASLPPGVSWAQMAGVGVLAGIGFTMSLFIAALALPDPAALATAKLAVLCASLIAGTLGLALLRVKS